MDGKKILEGLDCGQRDAVLSGARRTIVVAPPGSGKTRVLASRFAYLASEGAPLKSIVALTFTNRAASEMRERIAQVSGIETAGLNIGTFHSLCLKFLKKTRSGFTVYTPSDQLRLLAGIGEKASLKTLEAISMKKNLRFSSAPLEAEIEAGVFERYAQMMRDKAALDLDDLIIETIRAIEESSVIRGVMGVMLRHLLVDEFQDINPAQAHLVRLITGEGASLFAIGDPDQSIYAFRGANPGAFTGFIAGHPDAAAVRLVRNYRSGRRIVEASNSVISHNTSRGEGTAVAAIEGAEVRVVECADTAAQSEFVAKEIEALMGGFTNLSAGAYSDTFLRFSDFAVFFRTNRAVEDFASHFIRHAIPHQAGGSHEALYMDFANHLRAQRPEAGVDLAAFIRAEGAIIKAPEELVELFIHKVEPFGGGTPDIYDEFIEGLLLCSPADRLDIKADKVKLLTLHASKGLEFPVVFIIGMEEGIIPFERRAAAPDLEEERRLFYVGMTRAKERLFLMNARTRLVHGSTVKAEPSRFLSEIPVGLYKKDVIEKKRSARRPVQKGLFE